MRNIFIETKQTFERTFAEASPHGSGTSRAYSPKKLAVFFEGGFAKLAVWLLISVFFSFSFPLSTAAFAAPKRYDGIWFMGFNMKKPLFNDTNGLTVRKAFSMSIDRPAISVKIINDPIIPKGVIPPSMQGYDPSLVTYSFDTAKAKQLLKIAGYNLNDPRIKSVTLLHTNGKKTVAIAKMIQQNLAKIGVKVIFKQVDAHNQDLWEKELSSGNFSLYLMGYKATVPDKIFIGDQTTKVFHDPSCLNLPLEKNRINFNTYEEALAAGYAPDPACKPAPAPADTPRDTYTLIEPLFSSQGSANFSGYNNRQIDSLITDISNLDASQAEVRDAKLKQINKILVADPPILGLFYIEQM